VIVKRNYRVIEKASSGHEIQDKYIKQEKIDYKLETELE